MRWPERLYRVLLRCYPAEFRDEYASEMAQTFRDQAGAAPPARLWRDLLGDVAVTAPKEHVHVLMNDLRYTARMMRQAPAFTAAAMPPTATRTRTPTRSARARPERPARGGRIDV